MGAGTGELSLHELFRYLWPEFQAGRAMPRWPPDVFALVAIALKRSGSYASVVTAWPPPEDAPTDWVRFIASVGDQWRSAWEVRGDLPSALTARWGRIASVDHPLSQLPGDVVDALIELAAAADHASAGAGIPGVDPRNESAFDREAMTRLATPWPAGSTLCIQLHPSRVIVLPKLHGPRGGMSIRSLSHHLAAFESSEVRPLWTPLATSPYSRSLNLLLVPFPYDVHPAQFEPCLPDGAPSLATMPHCYGFFSYRPRSAPDFLVTLVNRLIETAAGLVGRIDGVVFPELAMTPEAAAAVSLAVRRRGAFLLTGIGTPGDVHAGDGNSLELHVPVLDAPPEIYVAMTQDKHHRWYLDKSQIVQYGLGGRLDLMRSWWESTALRPRRLSFLAMRPWLTLTPLICEDLARRDPVDDILRSVGPNLVIALLMDGPQLAQRWPARYAMALADDPHSSVLTLTSLGMTQLCRPPGKSASRAVAMWKDSKSPGPVELELPVGKEGLVLSLASEEFEEYTADGRSDEGSTGYPILAGIHPV